MKQNLRCNEQIRISPLRIIGPNNEQVGIVTRDEALRMARDAGMDLVEVAPNVRPPVCRVMDYGKWKYHQKKHAKKAHEQTLKEVRMRPKTDDHDREIKTKKALEFLRKGDKVQFTMMFRGRERSHREIGIEMFKGIIAEFGDKVKVERPPGMDGRNMTMILSPNPKAFEAEQKPAKSGSAPGSRAASAPGFDSKPADSLAAPGDDETRVDPVEFAAPPAEGQ